MASEHKQVGFYLGFRAITDLHSLVHKKKKKKGEKTHDLHELPHVKGISDPDLLIDDVRCESREKENYRSDDDVRKER